MRHRDDEWRPFFGETAEPYGAPMPPMELPVTYRTWEARRRWKIAQGHCPRSCGADLDAEGYCPTCGWSLTEERMQERLK